MKRLQRLIERANQFLERNIISELPNGKLSLGILRTQMPQIAFDKQQAFFDYLRSEGTNIHNVTLPAGDIKPTQGEINSDKVDKFVIGKKPVVISSDCFILDGHHQWAKAIMTSENMKLSCIQINMPITKLLRAATNFEHVEFKDINT